MASDIKPAPLNINGINLSNYILDKNSYNPVVYIHKKFFTKVKLEENIEISNNHNNDKCQQFDHENKHEYTTKVINNDGEKDPLIEQTIKFAKDIIPLTIPPSSSINPVCYTIKSKKNKRKHDDKSNFYHDATFDKGKPKSTADNVNRLKLKRTKPSYSTEVSTSQSNNTLDDVNENQSLCYSLSEISYHKHYKKDRPKKNKIEKQRLVTSESFEAIAAEYMNISRDKIKIHLMNEKDKQLFCENLSSPVIKAIKECFSESNQQNKDIFIAMQNHAKKLDNVFEKLVDIESKFDKIINEQNKGLISVQTLKPSKLEELGHDIAEAKEYLSSEEELAYVELIKNRKFKTASVTTVHSGRNVDNELDDLARGENILDFKETQLGIKPERPNRMPARFCWTDTVQK